MNHYLSMFVLLTIIKLVAMTYMDYNPYSDESMFILCFAYMYSQLAKGKKIKSKAQN